MTKLRIILALIFLVALASGFQWLSVVGSKGQSAATSYYYGWGCNGTTTNTCTVGGTAYSNVDPYSYAIQFTTGSQTNAVACGANFSTIDGTNKQFKCAIYPSGVSSHTPVTNCGSASTLIAATGWNEATLSGCTLVASTTYMVATVANGTGTSLQGSSASGTDYYNNNYTNFASYPTLTSNWSSSSGQLSIYSRIQ